MNKGNKYENNKHNKTNANNKKRNNNNKDNNDNDKNANYNTKTTPKLKTTTTTTTTTTFVMKTTDRQPPYLVRVLVCFRFHFRHFCFHFRHYTVSLLHLEQKATQAIKLTNYKTISIGSSQTPTSWVGKYSVIIAIITAKIKQITRQMFSKILTVRYGALKKQQ